MGYNRSYISSLVLQHCDLTIKTWGGCCCCWNVTGNIDFKPTSGRTLPSPPAENKQIHHMLLLGGGGGLVRRIEWHVLSQTRGGWEYCEYVIHSRFVGEPVNSASTECKGPDSEHNTAALVSEWNNICVLKQEDLWSYCLLVGFLSFFKCSWMLQTWWHLC